MIDQSSKVRVIVNFVSVTLRQPKDDNRTDATTKLCKVLLDFIFVKATTCHAQLYHALNPIIYTEIYTMHLSSQYLLLHPDN